MYNRIFSLGAFHSSPNQRSKSLFQVTLLLSGIMIFFLITLPHINEPFIHHHDLNSAYWSTVARNYAEYGILEHKLAMLENTGPLFNDTRLLTACLHPPLYPIILSTGITVFGDRELSTRIIQWFISLLLILTMWLTLKDLVSPRASLLSTLLAIFTPITLYFSTVCDFEQLALTFIYLSIWAYIKWFKDPRRVKLLIISLISYFAASQIDWQGYELAILMLHAFIFRSSIQSRSGRWKLALLYLPVGLVSFFIFLMFVLVSTGSFEVLMQRFIRRSGSLFYSEISNRMLLTYFHKVYSHLIAMYTRAYLSLFLICFSYLSWTVFKRNNLRVEYSLIISLMAFGLVHYAAFPVATFAHDYLTYYLIPAFTFTIAVAVEKLLSIQVRSSWRYCAYMIILLFLFSFITESRSRVKHFREAVGLDVREPAGVLKKITPVDSIIYTNMRAEGFQLGYYSRREIEYANEETGISYKNKYYLEFEGGDCTSDYKNRIVEEVNQLYLPLPPKKLIFETPCYSIYILDSGATYQEN